MHEEFRRSEATVEFLRVFNDLFDHFNSSNPLGKGMRAPLTNHNYSLWRPFLEAAYAYISSLKDDQGNLVTMTPKKTAFLGFLMCITGAILLCHSQAETRCMKYLLMYEINQDHVKLFFSIVRASRSANSTPTAFQLETIVKQLIVHN